MRPLPLALGLVLVSLTTSFAAEDSLVAASARWLEGGAGRPGARDPLPDRLRRRARRHDLPRSGPDGHARPADRADRLGRGDQGRQGLGLRGQALGRDGPGMDRRHALRRPRPLPLRPARHRRRRPGRSARGPHHGPWSGVARVQRDQRSRRLGRAARHGRLPLHLDRRQGDSQGGRQGRRDDPAPRRRGDPHPARRHRPGSRLDGRAQPAVGHALEHRRDLHVRQRRRQQEVAEQPDAPHRRRPLRISLRVPQRPPTRLARDGRADRRLGHPGGLLQRGRPSRTLPREPVRLRLGPPNRLSLRDRAERRHVRRDEPRAVRHQGGPR